MIRFSFLFAWMLLFASSSIAQITELIDSSGKYPFSYYPGDAMGLRKYVLQNGLTVMMSVNRSEPRVFSTVAVKAGSKQDPKTNTGLAHYLEHMLFKGTDKFGTDDFEREKFYLDQIDALYNKYNQTSDEKSRAKLYQKIDSVSQLAARFAIANEYDRMMEFIGVTQNNAFTSFDETAYISSVPSSQLNTWLKIESERFRNPILRIFHTELEAVYEEKNMSADSDDSKVFEAIFSSLFKLHTYGTQTTIGKVEHLKNPSLQAIRDYYKKYYVPSNMVVLLAGDINPDKAIEEVDFYFGTFQGQQPAPYKFTPERDFLKPEIKEVVGYQAPFVTIGYRLPGAKFEQIPEMEIFAELLGNSITGRLQKSLVDKQKVLGASSNLMTFNDYSVLYIQAYPRGDQTLEEVKDLIIQQIDSLKKGFFEESDLQAIKKNREIDFVSEIRSNYSRAMLMLNAFVQEKSMYDFATEIKRLGKVNRIGIKQFSDAHINQNYTIIYKREGLDTTIQKIDKPKITPVKIDRNRLSRFAKDILDNDFPPVIPSFVDFQKRIKQVEISQGVRLLHVTNKEDSLFSLTHSFHYGSLHDLRLPILEKYLRLASTKNFSRSKLSEAFFGLACKLDFNSTDDRFAFTISGPKSSLEPGLKLFYEILFNSIADEALLANLIEDELTERLYSKNNKNVLRKALSSYALYGKKNPVNYVITNKKLGRIKASDLTQLLTGFLALPHDIIYSGNHTDLEVSNILRPAYTSSTAKRVEAKMKQFKPANAKGNLLLFTQLPMVQADIGWIKPMNYNTNDRAKIELHNKYFGIGMSSLVFQTIRESKALAYSARAGFLIPDAAHKTPAYTAFVGTQADKSVTSIKAMEELLDSLPISELAYSSSWFSLRSEVLNQRWVNEQIVFEFLKAEKFGLSEDYRKQINEQLKNISSNDLIAFHKNSIGNKGFSLYIIGDEQLIPEEVFKSSSRKVVRLKPSQILGY